MSNDQVFTKSDIEAKVSSIWKKVLGASKISVHDSFFDAGGNSLLMTKVHKEIKKELEIPITIVELFQYPTIDSLSKNIHKKHAKMSLVHE